MREKTKRIGLSFTFLCFTYLVLITNAFVFGQKINTSEWTVLSEENKTTDLTDTTFSGKSCIKLDGKNKVIAWKKDANYKNFRVELDIAGAVMSGIGFHVANEQNYQFLYFRPGYGGTEEAIQYIPIYNGTLSWVFYGAYQNTADIKRLEWFHVVIEVLGDNLKVFTNNNKKPDMSIKLMKTEVQNGSILLRTLFGTSYFANIVIKELPESITEWEISEQLPITTAYGAGQMKKINKWIKINEQGDDYVNLSRYYDYPNGVIYAKHNIHSETEQANFLNFDFVGKMKILLNGEEVFNYAKYKLERLSPGTNRIRLNLKKGDNELVVISEGDSFLFGNGFKSMGRLQHQNWGFIATLEKMK
ncbi:protein of unknown function [Pseudarcicella hirudinis]|uniref:3-keto-alpha-glucoside-1,2-lyase/3-keto-2-hydroxy-glucal hydratase domain-containing protein n=1 Tax=Pseudarcicella hirudinis TaxID=1079859 RepID=A0A1I5RTH9_9BACT|nr:family 16 glycoside hydrolase [Pseudarcicella hirudinis]SFP61793.1 protein of unknown function [Pseudarcicella hirudinis]